MEFRNTKLTKRGNPIAAEPLLERWPLAANGGLNLTVTSMKPPYNQPLKNALILVAEDDAILAFDLIAILREAGAEIVGPSATLKHTLSLVKTPHLSAAVLDVNLRYDDVFPAALALEELGVSIVFYTCCTGAHELQGAWPNSQTLLKPASPRLLIDVVRQACEYGARSRAAPALNS
jgi:hypothetical protein